MSRPWRTVKGEQHFAFFLATESQVNAILVKMEGSFWRLTQLAGPRLVEMGVEHWARKSQDLRNGCYSTENL